jgi:hypothetical protein
MIRTRRRLDGASPTAPAVPGALGVPAVPAGKPARRRAARLARTLRTRWWPRFLLVGVLLVVVGATLVGGAAGTWVVGAGAAVIFVIAVRALSLTPDEHRREPPIPPGPAARSNEVSDRGDGSRTLPPGLMTRRPGAGRCGTRRGTSRDVKPSCC